MFSVISLSLILSLSPIRMHISLTIYVSVWLLMYYVCTTQTKLLWISFISKFTLCKLPIHTVQHKVLTYIEYRAVSGVFRTFDPPPPSPPSECVLPPLQRRGGLHSPGGGEGGGRSIFRKTPDIGLASSMQYNPSTLYSVQPLSTGHASATFQCEHFLS